MESIAGTKLICYTSRRSSLLSKVSDSVRDSPSNNKTHWKLSLHRRCRSKHATLLNKREKITSCLNGETSGTIQEISSNNSVKSHKIFHKIPHRNHKGKTKIADNGGTVRLNKRRRRKNKRNNVEHDEASRLQRRTRYLLIKMKLEQNLIDAYSGDGWKGQSREKIKPDKELQRAKKQIIKCKLGIRDAIRQLDLLSTSSGSPDSLIQTNGPIRNELIFCAKCRSREAFQENDILLCDGNCKCAFHRNCLEPPLEQSPPRDQPWLCRFCKCKFEILGVINAHLGTSFGVKNNWEDIFKESTACSDDEGINTEPPGEWPSEDSEDEDYNPELKESSSSGTDNEENISDASSCPSGLFCSSDDGMPYLLQEHNRYQGAIGSLSNIKNKFDLVDGIMETDPDIMNCRRQRKDVDYKKLYDEMFGKELNENEPPTEDEDWGPNRRKRRRVKENPSSDIVNWKEDNVRSENLSKEKQECHKRKLFRIPPSAVEKLRLAFAENELPSRATKESLSKQLGISSEKVSKWFKNARYAALRTRKADIVVADQTNTIESERLKPSAKKTSSSHEVPSIDSSCLLPLSSIIRVPKKLKKILQKKYPVSQAATPSNEQNIVTSKKLRCEKQGINTNKERNSSKELNQHDEVNKVANDEQLLAEMDKLFRLQDRLQNLKKALQSSISDNVVQLDEKEQNVIYVPVAEVRVKR